MRAVHFIAVALLAAAAAAANARAARIETVASGLNHPWSVAFLPDGRVLVTERAGRLRVIAGGSLQKAPVAGVPAVYEAGQGGLFDVLPHPRFAETGLLYLSYAHGTLAANVTRIARARLEGNRLVDLKVIFETLPRKNTPVHYGGRMAWLADGTLLMTTGDGFDFREQAQQRGSLLGKTVRITATGGVPRDNPFAAEPGPAAKVWTLGHRSPQGLAVDPVTRTVWQHEHGPMGGDEINRLIPGGNYGWPIATHGRDYSGAAISPFKRYAGMIDPLKVWVPSIAPSGLAVYRGAMFPEWNGDLLLGALVNEEVRRVDFEGGKPVAEQRIFPAIKARIRDIRVAPDGAVWVTTDEPAGRVLRVSK